MAPMKSSTGDVLDRNAAYADRRLLERNAAAGGLEEDENGMMYWPKRLEVTSWERRMIERLRRAGELVTAYSSAFDGLRVMPALIGPPAPPEKPVAATGGYEVSPAILALRERRKALGR